MCGRVSRMILRKFRSNVLWRTIQNQEPGVRVNRFDHVQESVLRDPVRRGVGRELARKEWSMRVHPIGVPLMDNLCPPAASHVCSKRDRDEGARGEDMGCFGPLGPPALACWNRCAQLSRPGSIFDPVRFWSDRTSRCRAAAESLRSLAMSASLGLWRVQVAASFP